MSLKNQKKVNKKKKRVSLGIIHIQATFNNTIVTVTDAQGNKLCSASAGSCEATEGGSKFKGKRKATPHAAQVTAIKACTQAKEDHGIQTVSIKVKGAGPQRELAMKSIFDQGFLVSQIEDVCPIPHNGVRPPKRRRV